LKIAPESRSAVYANLLIGTILLARELIQEAIERFKNALNIHPNSDDDESDAAHFGLGYAYVKAGDKQSAVKEYEILRSSERLVPIKIKHLKSLIDAIR
jgi:tetratricopeptide (TPR) repeat protein